MQPPATCNLQPAKIAKIAKIAKVVSITFASFMYVCKNTCIYKCY